MGGAGVQIPPTFKSWGYSGVQMVLVYPLYNVYCTMVTRMWANAQRDGRPAEHRWRPLFNAAKFGRRPLLDAVQ